MCSFATHHFVDWLRETLSLFTVIRLSKHPSNLISTVYLTLVRILACVCVCMLDIGHSTSWWFFLIISMMIASNNSTTNVYHRLSDINFVEKILWFLLKIFASPLFYVRRTLWIWWLEKNTDSAFLKIDDFWSIGPFCDWSLHREEIVSILVSSYHHLFAGQKTNVCVCVCPCYLFCSVFILNFIFSRNPFYLGYLETLAMVMIMMMKNNIS